MKKLILGTIFLFSSAIFAQVDTTQVSPEYKESSFQGDPETPVKLFTLDINNVYGTWKSSTNGSLWSFLPNKTFKLYSEPNDPKPLDGFWNLENNYINVEGIDKDGRFPLGKLLVKGTDKNVLYVNHQGNDIELVRVNNAKVGASKKSVTAITKPKRKVNSPLPIMEKNMIGKWQANNGTRYNFFYNNYFQLYSPNNPMIDCRWVLNNGYVVLQVLGEVIMKPQVISVSKTKMILAMDGGDLILTKM